MLQTTTYNFVCAGYLVHNKKVLLVLKSRTGKWVPPGGHVEHDERFDETIIREFKEETNLDVSIISAAPIIHAEDHNATPLPLPFYIDLEKEGFKKPTVVQFYYVNADDHKNLKHQVEELDDIGWFSKKDLEDLSTFDQVRSLATYAINNYPSTYERTDS